VILIARLPHGDGRLVSDGFGIHARMKHSLVNHFGRCGSSFQKPTYPFRHVWANLLSKLAQSETGLARRFIVVNTLAVAIASGRSLS